jgi:hypothetical protein
MVKLSEVQNCKGPLENFYMVSTNYTIYTIVAQNKT